MPSVWPREEAELGNLGNQSIPKHPERGRGTSPGCSGRHRHGNGHHGNASSMATHPSGSCSPNPGMEESILSGVGPWDWGHGERRRLQLLGDNPDVIPDILPWVWRKVGAALAALMGRDVLQVGGDRDSPARGRPQPSSEPQGSFPRGNQKGNQDLALEWGGS